MITTESFLFTEPREVIALKGWKQTIEAMLGNPSPARDIVGCLYENDDIIIIEITGTSPGGCENVFLYVSLLKDLKILRTKTGATHLSCSLILPPT